MSCKALKFLGGLILASTLATAGTAPMIEDELTVRVPFEFAVAGEVFPSGEYSIAYDKNWRLLYLCRDGAQCEVVQVRTMRELAKTPAPRLTFHKAENSYVLRLVEPGNGGGSALPGRTNQDGEIVQLTANNPRRHGRSSKEEKWHELLSFLL